MICPICNNKLRRSNTTKHCLMCNDVIESHHTIYYEDDGEYYITNIVFSFYGIPVEEENRIECTLNIKSRQGRIVYQNLSFKEACKLFIKYSNLKVFM